MTPGRQAPPGQVAREGGYDRPRLLWAAVGRMLRTATIARRPRALAARSVVMPRGPLILAVLALLATSVMAEKPLDSSYLRDHAQTRGFMLGRPARPKVTPDGK